jgi:hypothetical protein
MLACWYHQVGAILKKTVATSLHAPPGKPFTDSKEIIDGRFRPLGYIPEHCDIICILF